MRVKLFYKVLPVNQDPFPIITELENEVNKWVGRLPNPIGAIAHSTLTVPTNDNNGAILITVNCP